MITKIEIKNFESHKHTVYDNLSRGLNLFRGESDSGKSSAFRAVCVCAYNQWDEDMLRIGEKHSEILVETNKGSVKTLRGSGKNEWYADEILPDGTVESHFFEKIGKTVPEVVTRVLGMPKLEVAGVKETPNMMAQLDKHYMISDIGGKKCSSNMIAQIIDEVLGLTGTETLINDISLDGKRAKREANENDEQIKELKKSLHDEDDINKKKKLLEECQKLYDDYLTKKSKCEKIKSTIEKHKSLKDKQEKIEEKLKDYKDLDDNMKKYDRLKKQFKLYGEYKNVFDRVVILNSKLKAYEKKLLEMPDFSVLAVRMAKLKNIYKKYEQIVMFQENYEKKKQKLELLKDSYKTASQDLKDAEEEWERFRKEHPNCPTCGEILKKEICC